MGHYASEMMCSKCWQYRCTCQPPPDLTLNHWVVDNDYSVMLASAFQDKYSYTHYSFGKVSDSNAGYMRRIGRKHFKTKGEAEANALERLVSDIADSESRLAKLAARLLELQSKSV